MDAYMALGGLGLCIFHSIYFIINCFYKNSISNTYEGVNISSEDRAIGFLFISF